MKKLFYSFLLGFLAVVAFVLPCTASAATDWTPFEYATLTEYPDMSSVGLGKDFLLSHTSSNYSKYIYYTESATYQSDMYMFTGDLFYFPDNSEFVVQPDGSYKLTMSLANYNLHFSIVTFRYNSYGVIPSPTSNTTDSATLRTFYIDTLVYYPSDRIVKGFNGSTVVFTSNNVDYFDTNIEGFSPMAVDVSFTPSLSGSVNRETVVNGATVQSDYFSMTITNNGSRSIQFLMAVVPHGATFSPGVSTLDYYNSLGGSFSSPPIYYLLYEDWVFSNTIVGRTGTAQAQSSAYLQDAAWHTVKASDVYTRSFNWAQLPIRKGLEYDVVVLAVENLNIYPVVNFSRSQAEYYISPDSIKEVYRSTFSMDNPAVYDNTNTDFGNTPNSGGLATSQITQSAKAVNRNGEVEVKDIQSLELRDNLENWEPGIISRDTDSFDLDFSISSLQNLVGGCTGFINFIGSIFTWLPSWFLALILFGLTSLVTVGIIKAVL